MRTLHPRTIARAVAALAFLPCAYSSGGSTAYSVAKTAIYVQKDSGGALASSKYPYVFSAEAPVAATLTVPGGAPLPLESIQGSTSDFGYTQSFTTKSLSGGLDAIYPNGTYKMTNTGGPTLSFPLSTDSYPTSIPSVTSGTTGSWVGGVLMLDPTTSQTLDFQNFSSFGGAGVAGFIQLKINDLSSGGSALKKQEISIANSLGIPQGSTPFTSYSIPSGTLNPGDIYEATLQYATALGFDTTTVPGNGVITQFENQLVFYIVAQGMITPQPPVLTTDIANQSGTTGGSATFAPVVTEGEVQVGGNSVTLWYLNGQQLSIDGIKYVSNGTSLVINNLTTADDGTYFAKVLTAGGLVTTSNATLTVNLAVAPVIATQPESQTLNSGTSAVFTVAATGATGYQWEYSGNGGSTWSNLTDGGSISGSQGPQLLIQGATSGQAGEYECLVSSANSSTLSSAASLSIVNSPSPGFLVNISSRAFVGTGANILIGGFYVGGNSSRSVLIQGLGPALANEGVPGTLAHPALSIYNSSGAKIYSNTGWGSSPVLLKAAAAAYANPVLQANSSDSEVLLTLPPGGYTAQVSGADGGTGVSLCAIYQLP